MKYWLGEGGDHDWEEIYDQLVPGAHLASVLTNAKPWRTIMAIEQAGFEIRDVIMWVTKEGNIPIALARKDIEGTIAENVLKHDAGGLNIDGCRIGTNKQVPASISKNKTREIFGVYKGETGFESGHNPNIGRWPANLIHDGSEDVLVSFPSPTRKGEPSATRRYGDKGSTNFNMTPGPRGGDSSGRWPANLIHDGSEEVFEQFPITKSGIMKAATVRNHGNNIYGLGLSEVGAQATFTDTYGDEGSASRFFFQAVDKRQLFDYLLKLISPPTEQDTS